MPIRLRDNPIGGADVQPDLEGNGRRRLVDSHVERHRGARSPEGAPDVIVEADDEQIQVAGGAGDRGDLLAFAVEDRLSGQREPIPVPTNLVVPEGAPDVIVPMTNRSRLLGARETAAICWRSRSKTACPGSGNQSGFQIWNVTLVLLYFTADHCTLMPSGSVRNKSFSRRGFNCTAGWPSGYWRCSCAAWFLQR